MGKLGSNPSLEILFGKNGKIFPYTFVGWPDHPTDSNLQDIQEFYDVLIQAYPEFCKVAILGSFLEKNGLTLLVNADTWVYVSWNGRIEIYGNFRGQIKPGEYSIEKLIETKDQIILPAILLSLYVLDKISRHYLDYVMKLVRENSKDVQGEKIKKILEMF